MLFKNNDLRKVFQGISITSALKVELLVIDTKIYLGKKVTAFSLARGYCKHA